MRTCLGRSLVLPSPFGVLAAPRAFSGCAVPIAPALANHRSRAALRRLSLPYRAHHRDPVPSRRAPPEGGAHIARRQRSHHPKASARAARRQRSHRPMGSDRHVRRHFLSWTSLTLRHSLRPADPYRRQIPLPPRTAYGVWLPPSRRPPPALPVQMNAPERPWASPFKGFSSTAIGAPLGAHAFLTLPTATPPPRGEASTAWPSSRPCSRDEFVLSPEPRMIPAVDPFLGFDLSEPAPARPGARFIAAPPLSPSGGLTSRPAWASGYCGANEWDNPSPDRQLS
jgi:hypothetical protein